VAILALKTVARAAQRRKFSNCWVKLKFQARHLRCPRPSFAILLTLRSVRTLFAE
jgi:hypothetical protein